MRRTVSLSLRNTENLAEKSIVIPLPCIFFAYGMKTVWSRDHFRSHNDWSWSRPRSHDVLVSVSYVLVSWAEIDFVFVKCNDRLFVLYYFIHVIDNKAYRFVSLSHAFELTRQVSVSVLVSYFLVLVLVPLCSCLINKPACSTCCFY